MSDRSQIAYSYDRVLAQYEEALARSLMAMNAELQVLRNPESRRYRFHVRHSIMDVVNEIVKLDAQLKLFGEFTWDPDGGIS